MVVEEADWRYISNSCMLVQLKTLSAAMYQGYHVLDNIRYMQHTESVSHSFALSPLKRARTTAGTSPSSSSHSKAFSSDLRSVLENLEAAVANMVEFVVLLGGCERISRRPYDAYLGIDNFMFGRHVEKQQILGFLLRHDVPAGPPAVLPVTGGRGVGKRTLVAHVCHDERVRSHFTTILHLTGDGLSRIADHGRRLLPGRILVVVEFVSDVDDDDWTTFYSSVIKSKGGRCKVIIYGRDEKLNKFGTVEPICVNHLPLEEYRYLFKTLALGSADHPRLAAVVEEFAVLLGGSLISANMTAHAMRKNPDARFWRCKLNRITIIVELNMSRFGAHPNELFDRGRPVHLDNDHYLLSPGAPSCLVPSASGQSNILGKNLPTIKWDFLAEARNAVPPKRDFELITWESRLPPYTSFVHSVQYVPNCAEVKPGTSLSRKKRPVISE